MEKSTTLAQQKLNTDAVEDQARRMHADASKKEAKVKKMEMEIKESELHIQKETLRIEVMRLKKEMNELKAKGMAVPHVKRVRKDDDQPKQRRGRPRKIPLAVSYASILKDTTESPRVTRSRSHTLQQGQPAGGEDEVEPEVVAVVAELVDDVVARELCTYA
eukprot:16344-Hanusia_phi.AAC.16